MACREYEDELRELAAGGLAPVREAHVRAHVVGCAACREGLEMEAQLYAAVEAALREEMNAEVPASLAARIRMAAEAERVRPRVAWWRWAAVAGTAVAILIAVMVARREVLRVPPASEPAKSQQVARAGVGVPDAMEPSEKLLVTGAQGPRRTGIRNVRRGPEVIFVAGEEQELLEWVAERERWRAKVRVEAVSVALDATFEITPLEVKPLAEEQPE